MPSPPVHSGVRRTPWWRAAEWLLVAVAAMQFVGTALPPGNADLISVHSLALDLRRGQLSLLYPGEGFRRNDQWIAHHERNVRELGETIEPNWCFYPPLIPYALAGLALTSAESWRLTWGALQVVWVILLVLLTGQLLMITEPVSKPRTALLIALFAGSYPVVRSFELGQTSLLLAAILWSAVLLAAREKALRSRSWLVAVAGFVKPFLLVADLPMLARHKSRVVITTAAVFALLTLASLAVVGWNANSDYWEFLFTLAGSPTAYFGNQSLLAGGLRLFSDLAVTDYGFSTDVDQSLASLLCTVAILLIAAAVQWRSGRRDLILETGWWLSAVLLALPLSWEHHLVFLLPVLAALWFRENSVVRRVILGLATALITVNWTGLVAEDYPGRFIASFPLIGNLLLFVLIGLAIIHRESKPIPALD